MAEFVYAAAPKRVYWEMTRACDLACRHCRAEAIPDRDPRELTTDEGRRLLDGLRAFGDAGPAVVLTGGDPLKRPDFWELLAHGIGLGLDVAVAPSGTPLLTRDIVVRLKEAGVRAMSLSLDGSDPARHDGFRGVPGCFARTLDAAAAVIDAGISLQVNTLVTADSLDDLPRVLELVRSIGAGRWSLFFLIQVGRGEGLQQLTARQCEGLLEWLWARSREGGCQLTATEAPHYRRVALHAMRRDGAGAGLPAAARHGFGIRDGNGIMFVSHVGDVQPSGFLPLVTGNVRDSHPTEIYRNAPLFRELRDPDAFHGRCGYCEFRHACGGSRARAYAATGDPVGEDPLCLYEPGRRRAAGAEEEA